MMKILMSILALVLFFFNPVIPSYDQKTTEMFIPLGHSPGISGKTSVIGRIAAFHEDTQLLTLVSGSTTWSAALASHTFIWVDRSHLGLPTHVGTRSDLQKGRLIEVKFTGPDTQNPREAEWVKVQWPTGS